MLVLPGPQMSVEFAETDVPAMPLEILQNATAAQECPFVLSVNSSEVLQFQRMLLRMVARPLPR